MRRIFIILGKIPDKILSALKSAPIRASVSIFLALALFVLPCAGNIHLAYGADSDEIEDEIEAAQDEAEDIENEISSLNSQLEKLSATLEELTAQIAETEEAIAELEDEIESAQNTITDLELSATEQYGSLATWIQISYENDLDSMLVSVLSADSFSEVLAKAEYIQSLSDFGMDLIERYYETVSDIESEKSELELRYESLNETLDELAALEDEALEKKAAVTELIASAREELEDKNDEIDSLEAQLAAQLEYEAELEAEREAQEAARAAQIAALEAENTADAVISTDAGDIALLAAIIYCEAGGESYEGKLAVACVIMNRVRSSAYPNTISGVIYQSGQFSPASSGRLATVLANNLATESCYEAAEYVLAGNLPYPNFLSFCSASVSLGISTTVIGNHQFY